MTSKLRAEDTALGVNRLIARIIADRTLSRIPGTSSPPVRCTDYVRSPRPPNTIVAAGNCLPGSHPLPYPVTLGEVTERLKVHAWKVCVR